MMPAIADTAYPYLALTVLTVADALLRYVAAHVWGE